MTRWARDDIPDLTEGARRPPTVFAEGIRMPGSRCAGSISPTSIKSPDG